MGVGKTALQAVAYWNQHLDWVFVWFRNWNFTALNEFHLPLL